ncbi:hypothetical protein BJV77DRAFT_1067470 [Russula vinacea]|nr:hypothetical protein BJV77DRAFT_1067470 [Russula vinacea]
MTVGPVLLDASEVTALAGDPVDPNYENNLPDFKPAMSSASDTGATPVLSEPAAPSSVKKRKFGPRSLPLGQSAVPSQRNNSQDNVPGPSSQSASGSASLAAPISLEDEERITIQLLGPDTTLESTLSNDPVPNIDLLAGPPTAPSTRSKGKRKANV